MESKPGCLPSLVSPAEREWGDLCHHVFTLKPGTSCSEACRCLGWQPPMVADGRADGAVGSGCQEDPAQGCASGRCSRPGSEIRIILS